ncbi:hypothetical protein DFJ73DRAFT_630298 [Zopfochytrium polystomum]|nr:hypothetical protein DFJ73DRAFT_630298 [Zopfochytrium polystomum]
MFAGTSTSLLRTSASAGARSTVARRSASIIPPSISSMKEIGKLQSAHPQAHPEIFAKLKSLYKNLPKGDAPPPNYKSWYARYATRYENSLMPVLHFFGVLIPVGYYVAYFRGGVNHPTKEFH